MDYWLWFSSLINSDFFGPSQMKLLLDKFDSPEKVFKSSIIELKKSGIISDEIINYISKKKDKELNLRMIKFMKNNNIKTVNINDYEYPDNLKNIHWPPLTIFYKGDLSLVKNRCIGVVGTRRASNYGLKMSYNIGNELSKKGITVVSGLAKGIDVESHRGALANGGKTIAVVGTGLDRVYPSENYNICKNIEESGLVISEFVVGTLPNKGNFPARNRIISGLSSDIIVVEAPQKSGALITVDFALEQGKTVYGVPGNIDSKLSEGVNEIIKNGAMVYTCVDDVF